MSALDGGNRQHDPAMLFGLRVVMLGRQGSGKGTQGVHLSSLLVVPHISTGNLLRQAAHSGTQAGTSTGRDHRAWDLVDDEVVVPLISDRLGRADTRAGGFVLDGFPRTITQAHALSDILGDDGLDRAVVIDVPIGVATTRLLARRVCAGCGRMYSVEKARGLETWTCGACGGEVHRRSDDTDETVRRRLEIYDHQAEPILDWFRQRDLLLVVNGVGSSEDVFFRLLSGLWPDIPAERITQLARTSEPVPTGPAYPEVDEPAVSIDIVIEIPKAAQQIRVRPRAPRLRLDRRLFSATVYPADYGFIPDTLGEDGDPSTPSGAGGAGLSGCGYRPADRRCSGWKTRGARRQDPLRPAGRSRSVDVRDLDDMSNTFAARSPFLRRTRRSSRGIHVHHRLRGARRRLGEIAAARARLAYQQSLG